jgi:hypothetical protein
MRNARKGFMLFKAACIPISTLSGEGMRKGERNDNSSQNKSEKNQTEAGAVRFHHQRL